MQEERTFCWEWGEGTRGPLPSPILLSEFSSPHPHSPSPSSGFEPGETGAMRRVKAPAPALLVLYTT